MTDTQLQRMAQAAAVIRRVVGQKFYCHDPRHFVCGDAALQQRVRDSALLILEHDACDPLALYVNYGHADYGKIEQLSSALDEIGLMVEDCTGYYSGVYEATKGGSHGCEAKDCGCEA